MIFINRVFVSKPHATIAEMISLDGMFKSHIIICVCLALINLAPVTCHAGLAEDDPLINAAEIRNLSVDELASQAPRLVDLATADDKARVRSAIELVYVQDPTTTAALSFDELITLQRFYRYITAGDSNRGSIVNIWLSNSPVADTLTYNQQVWVLRQFETAASRNTRIDGLTNTVLSHLTNNAEQLNSRSILSSVRALAPFLGDDAKSQLCTRLGDEWSARIDSKTPFNLTDALEVSEIRAWQDIFSLLGDSTGNRSVYIDHLPDYLEKMSAIESYWRFRYEYVELLAQPIRTDFAREQLLTSSHTQGRFRQDILQVLSSSYWQSDNIQAWHQLLDTRISDNGISDDERAQWMMAKAYSLSLTDNESRYMPRRGLSILEDAMSVATTERTGFDCLKELVMTKSALYWFEDARKDIDEYRRNYGGGAVDSEALAQLNALIATVEHISRQLYILNQDGRR